jgi:hypothetical protein
MRGQALNSKKVIRTSFAPLTLRRLPAGGTTIKGMTADLLELQTSSSVPYQTQLPPAQAPPPLVPKRKRRAA